MFVLRLLCSVILGAVIFVACKDDTSSNVPIIPCQTEAELYSYVVYMVLTPINGSADVKPIKHLTSGIVPASQPGIRVPISSSGKYNITVIMTTEDCKTCCDSQDKGKLRFEFEFERDLTRESNGLSNHIPLSLRNPQMIVKCIEKDKC